MSDRYKNPLSERYSSREMQFIFSDDNKFTTWRKLWIALAEAQMELGLPIKAEQIEEMKAHVRDINYDKAAEKEAEIRHDVMAHIYAYGLQCPNAKPIIHLGATSCYVGDNTDIILMKTALLRIKSLLVTAISALADFAEKYKNLPALAFTHYQPAQPTTVGKRASLWAQDLVFDLERVEFTLNNLKLLGCRGATGTGAGFLSLFEGDKEKVWELERKITTKMGFSEVYDVSGQTYSRKVDYFVLSCLSGIAQSAHKFSNDIRLLMNLREIDEPFEEKQVGSSAMPYKRNPMRSERIASLSRYVLAVTQNPAMTASEQWFERTLDDSANKRICVPEAFLAADGILALYINIAKGMKIYPKVIEKRLFEELPFMAAENILMSCVKKGGDRQELHEAIREHTVAASLDIKNGGEGRLTERLLQDNKLGLTPEELKEIMNPQDFIGLSVEQTEVFLEKVKSLLKNNRCGEAGEIKV